MTQGNSRAHRLLDGSVAALAYTGPRSGRRIELPVQYAAADGTVVLWPGHPEGKRWRARFPRAAPDPADPLVRIDLQPLR